MYPLVDFDKVDREYHQLFAKAERSRKNIEKLERKLRKDIAKKNKWRRRYSETDKALVDAFSRRSDILYLAFGAVQQDEG